MRQAALIAAIAGAAAAVGLTLWTGRHNRSMLLMTLFTIWVLAPFAAMLLADNFSSRWTAQGRAMLHQLMLILTLGTLAIYGYVAFGPPRKQTAAAFLVVPAASLLMIAIVAALASRRKRPSEN